MGTTNCIYSSSDKQRRDAYAEKNFKRIKFAGKVYYGSDTDKHGTRLDVYLEEDVSGLPYLSTATIYDVEPDQNADTESIFALPRRVRFYHAKIDGKSLKSAKAIVC